MSFLWKPSSDSDGNAVVLLPSKYTGNVATLSIVSPDGQDLGGVRYNGTGNPDKGGPRGHYRLPKPGRAYPSGTKVIVKLNNGETVEQTISSPGSRIEAADIGSGANITSAGGSGGGEGFSGDTGGFGAVGAGGFGFAPQFIGDQFPDPVLTNYDPIPGADYQYIDPLEFGKYFNTTKRTELGESFDQGGDFAMKAIDTELKALTSFVPRSAALKRGQIQEDNAFNQAQRTGQVNAAIPDVVRDLNRVAGDARTYASGEVPNSVVDRGLEIGVRSAAADVASTSGFGVGSSAARKVSDLMSARERIGLSQYGLATLSENAAQRANLLLAPTSYSDTGQQIRVTPSLSGSQLQTGSFSEINSSVGVRGSEAFQANINQSQFISQLMQRTQEFNAGNTLQNDQFNATNQNNFALSYFNYLNSYVNSLAGAAQTNANAGFELDQQGQAKDEFEDKKDDTQDTNDVGASIPVIGGAVGVASSFLSDVRLKENVAPYTSALDTLKKLQIVKYNYKEKTVAADGKKPHIGLIAQELQKILPQSVGKHSSGYFQIDPGELIYILIAAVQELANG